MWQMDLASKLFMCLVVFQRTLCECLTVLGCDRGVSRLGAPGWMGHLCVFPLVWSTLTFVHSVSHQCKVLSEQHTARTHTACSLTDVAQPFSREVWFRMSLFNHKPDMPFPAPPGIRYDQNISNDLMTHIHQQVAVGSASRHATMTKYERGSKLLWLPRLPKGINPQTPVNYDVSVLNITTAISVLKGWCLFSVKTTCVWEWALIRPLMMKTRFRCCTAGLYLYQRCGQSWCVYCRSWHVKVIIKTISFVFKSLVAKSHYAFFTGNGQGFSHVYLCSAEFNNHSKKCACLAAEDMQMTGEESRHRHMQQGLRSGAIIGALSSAMQTWSLIHSFVLNPKSV